VLDVYGRMRLPFRFVNKKRNFSFVGQTKNECYDRSASGRRGPVILTYLCMFVCICVCVRVRVCVCMCVRVC
jgi:hypothetical protein